MLILNSLSSYQCQPISQTKATISGLGGLIFPLQTQSGSVFLLDTLQVVQAASCSIATLFWQRKIVWFPMLSFLPPFRATFGTEQPTGVLCCSKDMRHQRFEDVSVMGLPAANEATHLIMQSAYIQLLLLGISATVRWSNQLRCTISDENGHDCRQPRLPAFS